MTNKPENPRAFPIPHSNEPGSYETEPGMTLRDWFAGQALAGISCSKRYDPLPWSEVVEAAYQVADAMLAERMKEKP